MIEWSVGSDVEAKTHKINIVVIDQSMLGASGKLNVRVNTSPNWLDIEQQTVMAGRELVFKPVLVDVDDTEWVYSTGELPEGAAYDPDEGFKWTPGS